jgi:hypothetical protein
MITLFFLALVSTALMLLAVPVVAYALMLETCRERAAHRSTVAASWDDANATSGVFDSTGIAA